MFFLFFFAKQGCSDSEILLGFRQHRKGNKEHVAPIIISAIVIAKNFNRGKDRNFLEKYFFIEILIKYYIKNSIN